ncbi:MAG: tryptophan--tRNA ligase [Coprobacillus sp.]|nr:tryptophan--tRNA ligase [Coprobacillus sp.]
MARILTGVKPTGTLTLGNYIGVLKNLKSLQNEGEMFIFIADLHALTLPIEPSILTKNSIDIACFYLAAGLDPKKNTIFLQSSVSEHAELAIILQNYLYMGELSRMTQYKDQSIKLNQNAIGLGIFAYPVLMASDILLYDVDTIPVGEDQVQHVELTRDLANRFNKRYGDTFTLPQPLVNKVGKRIMSLSDPTKKMSKSDSKGDIYLLDDEKTIRKKIMSAVTDLDNTIKYDVNKKPGISNLLTIYAALSDCSIEEAEKHFSGCGYGDFKKEVAEVVVKELVPFQERYQEILSSGAYKEALEEGAKKAKAVASKTLLRVKEKIGLVTL